jgi:hypothetical protein
MRAPSLRYALDSVILDQREAAPPKWARSACHDQEGLYHDSSVVIPVVTLENAKALAVANVFAKECERLR